MVAVNLQKMFKKYWLLVSVGAAYLAIYYFDPNGSQRAFAAAVSIFFDVLPIIVVVFIFVGLIQVWVRQEMVMKFLGGESGVKGLFLASAFGTFLVGPLYVVFPLLKSLLQKGARLAIIVAILAAWAIKIPMIPLEIKFLGWRFALARSVLVFLSAPVIGLSVEKIVGAVPFAGKS